MAAKRRGRPELPEEDRRSEWVMVRLRVTEYRRLIAAAEADQTKPATLARKLLLRGLEERERDGEAPPPRGSHGPA